MSATRLSRAAIACAATGLVLFAGPGAAVAQARCQAVRGVYDEHPVSAGDCDSPVGLCIAGTYRGVIKGPFEAQATTLVQTDDTPVTTVQLFTSTTTISTSLRGRAGTLLIRNAGAFTANPDGSIVDLQTIVDGTGGLDGATGTIRAGGTFVFPTGGSSAYEGVVCLP